MTIDIPALRPSYVIDICSNIGVGKFFNMYEMSHMTLDTTLISSDHKMDKIEAFPSGIHNII